VASTSAPTVPLRPPEEVPQVPEPQPVPPLPEPPPPVPAVAVGTGVEVKGVEGLADGDVVEVGTEVGSDVWAEVGSEVGFEVGLAVAPPVPSEGDEVGLATLAIGQVS
jgi:hypothetical protein